MCGNCGERSRIAKNRLRKKIAEDMKAPLEGQNPRGIIDRRLEKVKGSATALLFKTSHIPPDRILALEQNIKNYLNKNEISQEDLKNIVKTNSVVNYFKCFILFYFILLFLLISL